MSRNDNSSPSGVDAHVGARVRMRRQILRMSQEELADGLGVTFQQVQKYERGANRISASRLYCAAHVLAVPVSFFFEGLDGPALSLDEKTAAVDGFINSPEGVALAVAFVRITSGPQRRQLLELARAMAGVAAPDAA